LTALNENTARWPKIPGSECAFTSPEKIGDVPLRYVARPDLGDAVRICAHGNYLILFEPLGPGVLILRLLHGARDLPGIFSSS
jgi:plasmid stabilization system protein ParE